MKINLFYRAIALLVSTDHPDLSARQMAILLNVYLDDTPQTVRGMARLFNIAKPAVTRSLDRLSDFGYISREIDPEDRRSIHVNRTTKGQNYVNSITKIVEDAANEQNKKAA